MSKQTIRRPGLILLVVLGMLGLFSLLAVTYVLFSGHSRAASVALARSEIRNSRSNTKPLFEEAAMQLIRGAAGPQSKLFGHDLLGDLYGAAESLQMPVISVRNWKRIDGGEVPMDYIDLPHTSRANAALNQRPVLIGVDSNPNEPTRLGHYLRIPIANASGRSVVGLPTENDAWTGRIATFTAGPLRGQSFRIVRYIGAPPPPANDPTGEIHAQQYSITIDLLEADLSRSFTQVDSMSGTAQTRPIGGWLRLRPPAVNADNRWTEGVYLCYENVAAGGLGGGYGIYINPAPLNSHGPGIRNDGSSQVHQLATGTGLDQMPMALQPFGFSAATQGDTDEPHDAADYNNMFLAFRGHDLISDQPYIDPSFHRAALINYIVNWKPLNQYTEAEFHATLDRLELAMGRTLSMNVQTPNRTRVLNPGFTGGNAATQLNITVPNWNSGWPSPQGLQAFINWLNVMTLGPWDVDNDSDGLRDSIWLDIGLPLQTSPDGKLLKALVAYYVDDLDKRLDVNATGSWALAGIGGMQGSLPTPAGVSGFVRAGQHLNQGLGYGPADISFQHLFGKNNLALNGMTPAQAFRNALTSRYYSSPSPGVPNAEEFLPGVPGEEAISLLHVRERRLGNYGGQLGVLSHAHNSLPGLPVSLFGRASYALDRLGNINVWNIEGVPNSGIAMTEADDPYESRMITPAHRDNPYRLAEWERIYRVGDSDRNNLPARLQTLFGESDAAIARSTLRHEITPLSRHLRAPKVSTKTLSGNDIRNGDFFQLLNSLLQLKQSAPGNPAILHLPPALNKQAALQLFPLEFSRGVAMNLNRPFGNGVDDNGNGEIDEPVELGNSIQAARYTPAPGVNEDYFAGLQLNQLYGVQGGLNIDPFMAAPAWTGMESRQLFARHLYCLAQLIVPFDYAFPNVDREFFQRLLVAAINGDADAQTRYRQLRARTLAQWAVNVVDFRDSDTAMTRFPYDSRPFFDSNNDGQFWEPDGVVWGMEQPELLLTESLATHDVRVKRNNNPERFDQYRTPEGSLFLELYCPRTTGVTNSITQAGVPTSLYTSVGSDVVLDVSRLSPANANGSRFPVWRVYLTGPNDHDSQEAQQLDYRTPHQRLLAPTANNLNLPSRHELTYQLPSSNTLEAGLTLEQVRQRSGLVFDLAPTDTLPDPERNEARVIVFASNYDTAWTMPGVQDTANQVYYNRDRNVTLHGNQYLVIGPREVTYFGSRRSAVSQPGGGAGPDNAPSQHRIELLPNWPETYTPDGTLTHDPNAANFPFRPAVSMVAAADLPRTWYRGAAVPVKRAVGLNVSEPNPNAYYPTPTARLNSNDTESDALTGALGFGDPDQRMFADAYHDYGLNPAAPARAPFDNGTRPPLNRWNLDPNADEQPDVVPSANNVLRPGTIEDWSTAYLQRLADPLKPWDAVLNPYITVDWIPIDLTLFSGEENNETLDPPARGTPGAMRLASRQKTGQLMNAQTLAFNDSQPGGQTFLSLYSALGEESTPTTLNVNWLDFEIPFNTPDSPRVTAVDGTESFATLGFLNTHYQLVDRTTVPDIYRGGPADPTGTHANWHPHNLFWANRQYVNGSEIALVPLSSPGQVMQEFSAVNTAQRYEPAYRDQMYPPRDSHMPTSPVTANMILTNINGGPGRPTVYASHLINFFQEVPELRVPQGNDPHPKNTSLAWLMDLVETPGVWVDSSTLEPPQHFRHLPVDSGNSPHLQAVMAANNQIFAPYRAPYNGMPSHIEPGRVNLNTLSERNVFQGLWSNVLLPAQRQVPFAHQDGSLVDNAWRALQFSRRGYEPFDGHYRPGAGSGVPNTRFNAHFPTEFAGLFKPVAEAGMVPATRLIPPPPPPIDTPAKQDWQALHLATMSAGGVLDVFSRSVPVNHTLLRGRYQAASEPWAEGVSGFDPVPLFMDTTNNQTHVFTDMYPMSRLANLTSERSNTFAVYITLGFFEYDPGTGVGIEYGSDRGEAVRSKAFYVIDRSIPVGYRIGEDLNAGNTILIRRYLSN
jgi:hypothetical protein